MVPPFAFVIIRRMLHRISRAFEITLAYVIFAALFSYSNPPLTDKTEKVRAYTRNIEFNYISWTMDAALLKVKAASIGLPFTLDRASQKQVVTEYLRVTQDMLDREYALEQIYADAKITDKQTASTDLRGELDQINKRQRELAPLTESILQGQVSEILAELGLTTFGQPIPNVLFHSTPLPDALIVSPRDHIEQIANVSVNTDLTVDERAALETHVDKGLNTSSLVVPIGGVGVYPTMVMQSTDLPWLLSTISHEWTHNYLTLRPLGFLYLDTPELRTMNETTASIAGDEIGTLVLKRFYPELAFGSPSNLGLISESHGHPQPGEFLRPPFDFRAKMHETRITTDSLLFDGRIDEAEAYMESQRLIFLQNGYLLRKINQAYFAFYGAYADVPGGAAGEDPVGPAVRALRAQSDSLADFINTIAWMTSFEDLKKAVKQ
jgi:hypothetical protein